MAENSGQERTEEPTPKRLREAKEKGQVARSRELVTMSMLLAAGGGILVFGESVANGLMSVMRDGFNISRRQAFDVTQLLVAFLDAVSYTLVNLSPFFALMMISAVAGSMVLSGWNFSVQALAPKFNKLNPITGAKRIVGPQGFVELLKALAKFFIVGGVAVLLLWNLASTLLGIGNEPLRQALAHLTSILAWSFLAISSVTIVIAVVDAPFQLWQHKRQLKMTRQEVKQENKDTDGSPEVKGRVRRMQMEMAQRRMMQEVPKADVVITNPTHFAVALRYDQKSMRAPRVVAKGADLVAMEIRHVAAQSQVPIMSAPPLARAIYHSTELNREIPAGLYVAVAQVLAYVFQLRQKRRTYSDEPIEMSDLPIPDDLRRDDGEQL